MKLTEQQIFNRVVKHLRKQRKKSVNSENKICLYRGPNNTSCAVGCLIPNKAYSSTWEGTCVMDLPRSFWNKCKLSDSYDNKHFLCDLQSCHDYYSVGQWEKQFKSIAEIYNLKVPPKIKS